jgi:hypothetical protein
MQTNKKQSKRGEQIMTQGVLPFKYEESKKSKSLTSFSGLFPFLDLLSRLNFFELADKYVKVHEGDQGWFDSQLLLSMLLINLSGGDCPQDIERLESDSGLCKGVRTLESSLLGKVKYKALRHRRRFRKGRKRCFSSANSIRTYLESFHNDEGEVNREIGKCYIPESNEHLSGLYQLMPHFLRFMQLNHPVDVATLDIDATIVESNKCEALYSYKKFKGFQPFNVWWNEQHLAVHSEFRDGNVKSGFENKRVVEESLNNLPSDMGIKQVYLRGDSEAKQYELMDFCENGDERFGKIGFAIGIDIVDGFRNEVIRLGEEEWHPIYRDLGNGIKIKSRQEWAEVPYVGRYNGPDYRYIAIRERAENQGSFPGMEVQKELLFPNYGIGGVTYKLSGIVTNLDWDGEELIHWYRKRCGDSELAHSIMKSDLAGGKLPSGKFGANACWWYVMILALNLNEMLKRLALSSSWHNRRLKSLRYWFIGIAARVEKKGRQLRIILDKGREAFEIFIEARKRIAALKPLPGG